MTGYLPMLRKEFVELLRTWRIWLLGVAFGFFGIIDPIIARFSQEIVGAVVGDTMSIDMPDPTPLVAWSQWAGDLNQLLLVVVIIMAAGAVAGETSSGTFIMPLTKPLSRAAFVLAKLTAVSCSVALATLAGTGLTCGMTSLLFEDVTFAPVWRASAVWVVLAILMIAVTMVASCLLPSTIAAFGVGFGGYIVVTLVSIWQPSRTYSPAGLPGAVTALAGGEQVDWPWPVASGLLGVVVFLTVAVVVFNQREL